MNAVVESAPELIKVLDIGCGPNKQPGAVGMDAIAFPGVDIVHDLSHHGQWPLADNSVESAHCSHVLEHLTNFGDRWERVRFFNELWRVMVPVEYGPSGLPVKGFARIIIPHWASNRYYGDPTHKEPFGEMAICYLDPVWRKANAPHTDSEFAPHMYNCHWAVSYDYTLHQEMAGRNQEYVRMAVQFYKEAAQDIIFVASCIKK